MFFCDGMLFFNLAHIFYVQVTFKNKIFKTFQKGERRHFGCSLMPDSHHTLAVMEIRTASE